MGGHALGARYTAFPRPQATGCTVFVDGVSQKPDQTPPLEAPPLEAPAMESPSFAW